MATGEPKGAGDPFEERVDFEESLDRVKKEGQRSVVGRLVERIKSLVR